MSACRNILIALTVVAGLLALVPEATLNAQNKPKDLVWTHAFDLACRKYGEADFSKDTKKYGVEAFKDNNNGLGLYLSQVGSPAVTGGFGKLDSAIEKSEGPEWLTGLDLPARKAGELEFSDKTKVHAMEVFRDPNSNNWIYITEKGYISTTPAKNAGAGSGKAPKWSHSVDLSVRKGGVKDWDKALKYGIEVYRDESTGNFIYISDIGSIAVISAGDTPEIKEGKAPVWLHGLDLACRQHDETSFTKDTRRYGLEVYHDVNTGNLIYICESGHLAVTPAGKDIKAPTPDVKAPDWTHGLNVRTREVGEKEFTKKTRTFGGEVFRDINVGTTLYIFETGMFSVEKNK